jgi:hypothetical protein
MFISPMSELSPAMKWGSGETPVVSTGCFGVPGPTSVPDFSVCGVNMGIIP